MSKTSAKTMAPPMKAPVSQLFPNAIRLLAADAVQTAGSGHPGAPMGQADMAYVLWDRFLTFDPDDLNWFNRDRFVLSSGHGCLLLYSLLHLYGCGLKLEDLRQYRQWGSLTPGHPEHGHTPGVETTTGPLGQGVANAVGMALAERHLAARFNRDGYPIVDHRTYCICSDGDLMEGVSAEAASLAGHLALHKLTVLYDDNGITIGGSTRLAFTEDVAARFGAYGWHVIEVDGHDHDAVTWALDKAKTVTNQPTFIKARTHIGFGSPHKQDTSDAHGAPLGEEEVKLTKEHLGWPPTPAFYVPDEVYAHARGAQERGRAAHSAWTTLWNNYAAAHSDLATELTRRLEGKLPAGWDKNLPQYGSETKKMATRNASGKVLNALAKAIPELIGGSADLEPSNKTLIDGEESFSNASPAGRNIHFGVREHAMGSIVNGIAYHGGLRPYNGTFLVFSDYQRPAVRLASLVKLPVVYVYTHDSIGVGGDGPTHQPVEHLISLRAIPGLTVIRPADANETRVAWQVAMERRGPTALILTRQDLPVLANLPAEELRKGAYVAHDPGGADAMLISTGSELYLCLEAAKLLSASGKKVRVVSMPSWELFEEQPAAYRESVLPEAITRRLAVEAALPAGWWKYVGSKGRVLGVEHYGASAPETRLFLEFGLTTENIVKTAQELYGS